MRLRLFSIAAVFLLPAMAARASSVITFSGLPGNDGAPFTTWTENGFTVSNSAGQFLVGTIFGAPVPSLFSGYDNENLNGTSSASIVITATNGSAFSFDSADMADDIGVATYALDGTFGSMLVYQQTGTIASADFATYAATSPGTAVTSLTITETGGDFNVDNIALTPETAVTPEPSSFLLLGTGLLGVAGVIRRRMA